MKSEWSCNETIIKCEWESMTYVEHVVSSTRRRKGHPAERSCCRISMTGKWPTSCSPAPKSTFWRTTFWWKKQRGVIFSNCWHFACLPMPVAIATMFSRVLFFPMTECKVQLTTLCLYKFMDFGIMSKRRKWVSKYKISDTD